MSTKPASRRTGLRRLKRLGQWLQANAAEIEGHFDMRTWFSHTSHDEDGYPIEDGHDHHIRHMRAACGTSACALGWATAVFPRHLAIYGGSVSRTGVRYRYREDDPPNAAIHVFAVSNSEFGELFYGATLHHERADSRGQLIETWATERLAAEFGGAPS